MIELSIDEAGLRCEQLGPGRWLTSDPREDGRQAIVYDAPEGSAMIVPLGDDRVLFGLFSIETAALSRRELNKGEESVGAVKRGPRG